MVRRGSWYDEPDYENLDEVAGPPPVENPNERSFYRHHSLAAERSSIPSTEYRQDELLEPRLDQQPPRSHQDRPPNVDKSLPSEPLTTSDSNALLSEVAGPPPVQFLGDSSSSQPTPSPETLSTQPSTDHLNVLPRPPPQPKPPSPALTRLYTLSHLVFFSLLGTLARLGLQAITFYPGAPVATPVLWANFGGSLVYGFLAEDRKLFREEWGDPLLLAASSRRLNEEKQSQEDVEAQRAAARKRHHSIKKTIPLYIGLATGFCGSFTSFSSFVRDCFLALSNNLPSPINHPVGAAAMSATSSSTVPRPRGDSFMAVVAVILLTVCLSLGALKIGAHLALGLERCTPSIPFRFMRLYFDPCIVLLAFGSWIGAVIMAVFPPQNAWRGEAVFALVFAPLGCLARFYASLSLNGKIASFPLGTFAVNIFGTAMLGMFYDLQHASLGSSSSGGGVLGCQILQGMTDGFCGCLTTVSTWVGELNGLRRRHAYVYGTASVVGGLSLLVVIMGSLRWTLGFAAPACVT